MDVSDDKYKEINLDKHLSWEYYSYCFTDESFVNNMTLDDQVEIGLPYLPKSTSIKTQDEKDKIRKHTKNYLSTSKGGTRNKK